MISMSRCPWVPKPEPGDAILVDDAQRPEAHVPRVLVAGEGEAMCVDDRANMVAWPRSAQVAVRSMA